MDVVTFPLWTLLLLAFWAKTKERQMIVEEPVAARSLQLRIRAFHDRMVQLDLASALPADQVMMPVARDLVDQMALVQADRPCEAVLCQETESPVYRCLRQA